MGVPVQQKKVNVAAYCRVSTEAEEQQNSYQVQIEYYTNYINSNPKWTLAGIFADEGISGTQTKNRTEFNRMIRMCKKKKIDRVVWVICAVLWAVTVFVVGKTYIALAAMY